MLLRVKKTLMMMMMMMMMMMFFFGEHSLTVGEKASPAAGAALGNVAAVDDAPTATSNLTPSFSSGIYNRSITENDK